MKIKFLLVIAIFLLVSLTVTSYLSTANEAVEHSSDDTTHAFALRDIEGIAKIKRTNNRNYNADSLPLKADRIINETLIKTFMRLENISVHYIYQKNALSSNKIKRENLFVREFSERKNYSTVLSPNNFTWIRSKDQRKDKVWRG